MTPAAFMLVCTLFGKTRSIKREVLSFRVVSSVKPKYVMETYRSKPEDAEEKEFYDYLPEDPIMLRVCRASFVDGFAEANSRPSVSKTTVAYSCRDFPRLRRYVCRRTAYRPASASARNTVI